MESKEVTEFYNQFNFKEKISKLNLRHYTILNNLLKLGIRSYKSILEIGCGTGQLSQNIIRINPKAQFLGTDISESSISFLNNKYSSNEKVAFVVSDSTKLPSDRVFDFVYLADVLEHIPVSIHKNLFDQIGSVSAVGAKLVINIPTAQYINWQNENEIDQLQIIDQALSPSEIIQYAELGGFVLVKHCKYSLFHLFYDYEYFIFVKGNSDTYEKVSKLNIQFMKLKERIRFFIRSKF